MNFAPIWKRLNAGEIDSFQAFAMCESWVTVERFNRQYQRYMERTRRGIWIPTGEQQYAWEAVKPTRQIKF